MSSLSLRPNLATVPPDMAFLPALAAWWLAKAGTDAGDPLAVAQGIFLVPTRRAARSLAQAFLDHSNGQPLLLPRILALGAVDEAPLALSGTLAVPPPVSAPRRLAVLSRMILAMGGRHGAPREADRAWALAEALATLLDEAARAEIDLAEALPNVAGEAYASHWQITLDFLQIVTAHWPAWLAAEGVSDIAAHQIALLDAQTAAWRAQPPALPVIAAGTTGAIPAVGRLLRLVAHLPQGLVVLPGLDLTLDEASWDTLQDSHPQASLRDLLGKLQARRGDVRDFEQLLTADLRPNCPASRSDVLRQALLPAGSLPAWQALPAQDTAGLERMEPADQQEEAVAIALALRDALEVPGARAALVTPDRQLAGRVAAELLRFGVVADDSAGEPLAETPPAVFLRLLAQAIVEDLRPVPLLALLKHPFSAAGLSPAGCRAAARRLEVECLRGPRPGPGIEGLLRRRGDAKFLDRIANCLKPLLTLTSQGVWPPNHVLDALVAAAEALAATDTDAGADRLWANEDGAALALHLSELAPALAVLPEQRLETLPGLLDATMAGQAVRSRRGLRGRDGTEHPRVFIWGLLEARLQTADLLVLGGLSEGVWPPIAEAGPWMSRAMRTAAGLPSPEAQVGLSAHDFVMCACAAPRVVLSAPGRRDGAPSVPSRWLARLDALLSGQRAALARHPAPQWARALDRPAGAPLPVPPPAPAPPVALRPRRLSVTQIETWLRDPYAIYARHVLRLRKLDPLEQSADAADYGSIVHEGLHRFFQRVGIAWPPDAPALLAAEMDEALRAAEMRPALAAWWRPRLRRIAAWVAAEETLRRQAGSPAALWCEQPGSWVFEAPAGPFTLHGRADRIERGADGGLAILDYKTGAAPTGRAVADGLAPQLLLEAAMVRHGAFGAELSGQASELAYWQITGGFEPGKIHVLKHVDAAGAEASLRALVSAFDDPGRAYLSQPSPGAAPRFTDYAQLARVAEWSAAEE